MISETEKRKMMKAHSIGPRMIAYLEEIGIERLSDLAGADARELALRINVEIGRRHINQQGVRALANLIALAKAESRP